MASADAIARATLAAETRITTALSRIEAALNITNPPQSRRVKSPNDDQRLAEIEARAARLEVIAVELEQQNANALKTAITH